MDEEVIGAREEGVAVVLLEEEEEPKLREGSKERRDFVFVVASGGWVDIMTVVVRKRIPGF